MTTIDTARIDTAQLAGMLRACAQGDYPSEAAVELLIGHRSWLDRADFRRELLHAVDDGWVRGATVAMASIEWEAVEVFLDTCGASGSERRILLLASSLAGHDHGESLRELLTGLDHTNARLVLDAIAHTCGWHEHGLTATITGQPAHSNGAIR